MAPGGRGGAQGAPSFRGGDDQEKREVDQVLLDLGIEPVLAEQGYLQKQLEEEEGGGGNQRRGEAHPGAAMRTRGVDGRQGDGIEDGGCDAAAEAAKEVRQMLHLAHA